MKMSTMGRYGLRAMIDLAERTDSGTTSLKEIASRQDISPSYLHDIMLRLKAAGLVKSRIGPNGGFVLGLPASEIKLLRIITSIEGSVSPTLCVDDSSICPRASQCPARHVWVTVKDAIEQVLETTSLQDVVESEIWEYPCRT